MIGFSTRREFCLLLATAVMSSSRLAGAASTGRPAPRTIRIGVLGSAGYDTLPGADDARAGLTLGVDEAVRTAAMFGLTVEFVNVLFSDDASHRSGRARHGRAGGAARRLVGSGAVALVAAAAPTDAAEISAVAEELRVPYIDLLTPAPGSGAGADTARTSAVAEHWTLYVAPPRPMPAPAATDSVTVHATAWRHDLQRYGAAQLNDRYRARFGHSARMNGNAWAGWFAAKALVEACLRGSDPTPAVLRDTLFALRYDGHKGVPLYFSPDGVLQQPVYPPADPA